MSEPFLGQLMPVGFNFAPRGWALCEGQLLAISQYSALFSLLGTTYGGDGRTTFGLPDLRSRSIVGVGTGPGLDTTSWGEKAGDYEQALTVSNLPSHTHTVRGTTGSADASSPSGARHGVAEDANRNALSQYSTAAADVSMASDTLTNTGGGNAFNIRNPYLGMYWCIALTGIFPSRS